MDLNTRAVSCEIIRDLLSYRPIFNHFCVSFQITLYYDHFKLFDQLSFFECFQEGVAINGI
jgi:hypothetical protein